MTSLGFHVKELQSARKGFKNFYSVRCRFADSGHLQALGFGDMFLIPERTKISILQLLVKCVPLWRLEELVPSPPMISLCWIGIVWVPQGECRLCDVEFPTIWFIHNANFAKLRFRNTVGRAHARQQRQRLGRLSCHSFSHASWHWHHHGAGSR